MRRREFIAGLCSAGSAWPLVALAQPVPLVGFLHSGTPQTRGNYVAAFRHGLAETGYVDRQNVAIEYRWANDRPDQLTALAADLVRRGVAVITAAPNASAAIAARTASPTIPVVFRIGDDPIALGLVASLAKPGSNITGIVSLTGEVIPKRLELLHELVPAATVIALLVNPANSITSANDMKKIEAAALVLGMRAVNLKTSTAADLEAAFTSLAKLRVNALVVNADALFSSNGEMLVALAARERIPAIYAFREIVAAGGLMSYGTDTPDTYRKAGNYVGRILKGEKAADLPVQQVTKVELAINLGTAKALGLTFPETLKASADEVIE
jgi:putative tryptophan/tyrosine transport system substrate-binding protein